MPIRRCRLGASYIKSPAQNVKKWIIDNMSKIIFACFISLLWLGILFTLIGVVRFVGGNVGEVESFKSASTLEIFNHPFAFPVKIIGIALIWIYVFRDSLTNR